MMTATRTVKQAKPRAKHPETLAGDRFGRLTTISPHMVKERNGRPRKWWLCLCDCQTQKLIRQAFLRRGKSRSCGCLRVEVATQHSTSHGLHHTREYGIHRVMLERCYNPENKHYHNYGARGIAVCDRWRFGEGGKTGFECFYEDMGPRPSQKHSIDRKENDGGYEKTNCRWATALIQGGNRRGNVRVTVNGENVCMSEAARRTGIPMGTAWARKKRGLPESEWFKPIGRKRRSPVTDGWSKLSLE